MIMMNTKKFLLGGIASGILILILGLAVSAIVATVLPYDAATLPGMRAVTDPLMTLFFLYPFVLGFVATYVYGAVKGSFVGNYIQRGKKFGLLFWLLAGLPSIFIVFTSMDYPIGFTVAQIIASVLYSLGAGMLIARIHE